MKYSNPNKYKRPRNLRYCFWYWCTIGRVLFVDMPRALKERRK